MSVALTSTPAFATQPASANDYFTATQAAAASAAGASGFPSVVDSTGRRVGSVCNFDEVLGVTGDVGAGGVQTELGMLPTAPAAVQFTTTIDCGVFWYQDYGLEYTRVAASGSMVWYDWRWNFMRTDGYVAADWNPLTAYVEDQHSVDPTDGRTYIALSSTTNEQPSLFPLKWRVRPVVQYFPDRHPSLGWYRGDDPHILSWQAKWLVEYGVRFALCQQRVHTSITANWEDPEDVCHWLYQLMTNVPAVTSGQLKLAFWLPKTTSSDIADYGYANGASGGAGKGNYSSGATYAIGDIVLDAASSNRQYVSLTAGNQGNALSNATHWMIRPMPTQWTELVTFYTTYSTKIKAVTRNSNLYAVVLFWEGEVARAAWGNGSWRIWLQDLGAALNAAVPAWAGVAVLCRNSPTPSMVDGVAGPGLINYDTAETNRALILRGDYNGTDASSGAANTYQSLIDVFPTFSAANKALGPGRRVYAVPTSLYTVAPHDSNFAYIGHTPTKFASFVSKTKIEINASRAFPLVMVNNMSEWAESGPGLQPNQQDGFGYLEAIKTL